MRSIIFSFLLIQISYQAACRSDIQCANVNKGFASFRCVNEAIKKREGICMVTVPDRASPSYCQVGSIREMYKMGAREGENKVKVCFYGPYNFQPKEEPKPIVLPKEFYQKIDIDGVRPVHQVKKPVNKPAAVVPNFMKPLQKKIVAKPVQKAANKIPSYMKPLNQKIGKKN